MSAPWAAPGLTVEERAARVELAVAGVDTGNDRRRVVREAIEAALEEAARREDDLGCYVVAARIRALKGPARG